MPVIVLLEISDSDDSPEEFMTACVSKLSAISIQSRTEANA